MDFAFTEDQKLIQKMAKDFADTVVEPLGEEIDKTNEIPDTIIDQLRELGFFGFPYPEEFGGGEFGYTSYPPVLEAIARASTGVAMVLSVHYLGMAAIDRFGNEEQRKKWVTKLCSGEAITSFAFTEPDTGSDPKQVATVWKKVGDKYVINGVKRFISNADYHGPIVIFANDSDRSGKITAFIIEKHCKGYSLSEPWDKLGCRGSHAYDIYLNDVEVGEDAVLGEIGKGFPILQHGIACGKCGMSALFLGCMQSAYEEAMKYVTKKPYRNGTIAKFQAIKLKMADIASKIEAARWLEYRLGYLLETLHNPEQFEEFNRWSALTKLFVTDTAMDVVRKCVNAHGSYGVMQEFKVSRLWRDVVIGEQIEGANDLQRLMVVKEL